MKKVFNVILTLCVLGLIWVCYGSIMGPIKFEKAKKLRDKQVISRLIDIRKAQVEYRLVHDGRYTASLDTLIDFVKTGKLPIVKKEGSLTDDQLADGLTEKKAVRMIEKARKTGNWAKVKKAGLENFSRDTTWVAVLDSLYPAGYVADSMRYVPFGNGAIFEMAAKSDTTENGMPINLFQAQTPYTVYLDGLNKQEITNLIDIKTKLGRYCGLRVGDIEEPNNNAGNWE